MLFWRGNFQLRPEIGGVSLELERGREKQREAQGKKQKETETLSEEQETKEGGAGLCSAQAAACKDPQAAQRLLNPNRRAQRSKITRGRDGGSVWREREGENEAVKGREEKGWWGASD